MANIKCTNKKHGENFARVNYAVKKRKRKIKDDHGFLEFYKPYKKRKQTKTTKILNMGQF